MNKAIRRALMIARGHYADGGETDPMLNPDVGLAQQQDDIVTSPMGDVYFGSRSKDYSQQPGYDLITRAQDLAAKYGQKIGEPAKAAAENYIGNVYDQLAQGSHLMGEAGKSLRMEDGRLPINATWQYPLGAMQTLLAPVGAAGESAGQLAANVTGDPTFGEKVGFLSGFVGPGEVKMGAKLAMAGLPGAAERAAQLAREASAVNKAGEVERAVKTAKDVAGEGEMHGPPEMYGPKTPASIIDTSHEMNVERGERKTINPQNIRLTPSERDIVNSFESPGHRAMVAGAIRNTRSRYPVSDGWAPMELTSATINDQGLPELKWQQPAYGFNRQMQTVQKVVLDETGNPVKAPKLDKNGNPVLDENGNPVLLKRNLTEPAQEERAMRRGTPEYDRAVERAARNSYREISDIVNRANNGDEDAKVMLRQVGWYREFMRKGFDERGGAYPAFSDLLGATSPNTAVDQNYAYAIDAQRRHARGDFDPQVEFARNYQGNLTDFPADQLIRRDVIDPKTGEFKQYGMNSRNAQMAMADRWRDVEPGSAPKARNFSGNLGGATDAATIDVWAARHLQRMLGRDRLPPPLEGGVKGKMEVNPNDPNSLRAGGEFGFGQDVFQNLSDKINQSNLLKPYLSQLGYSNATPMDLQALAWFLEKEHWTKRNWTTAAGEGGSFEQEMARNPAQRWQSGFSITQEEPPTDALMAKTRGIVDNTLKNDPNVNVYRTNPTFGRYYGSNERAFDSELTAHPDWNPSQWMASVIQQAKEHNQKDLFFSKRLSTLEAENNPNARPGAEIYFQNRKEMQDILPILDEFTNRGQDGFTFVTDLRHRERTSGGADVPDYVGVRMQYVPEIRMRYDPEFREKVLSDPNFLAQDMQNAQDKMQDAIAALDQRGHKIVDARIHHYDTLTLGKESYDKFLNGITDPHNASSAYEGKFGAVNPITRFGKPIHSHVTGRDHALREGAEGGPSNTVPTVAQPDTGVKTENAQNIRAYHGSPHDFEQFDTSRIGTGEGAQAYGHGLYFAEHEPVAKDYRDKLTEGSTHVMFPHGDMDEWGNPIRFHPDELTGHEYSAAKAVLNREGQKGQLEWLKKSQIERDEAAKAMRLIRSGGIEKAPPGHMYEVHINAPPHHFLDWDKPLSEQSEYVQNAFKGLKPSTTGEEIHRNSKYWFDGPEKQNETLEQRQTRALQSKGIKGIRYLDAGSRGTDQKPTHNYVVFDHNDVDVKRKYEQGGLVVDRALSIAQKFGPVAAQDAVNVAKQLARGRP